MAMEAAKGDPWPGRWKFSIKVLVASWIFIAVDIAEGSLLGVLFLPILGYAVIRLLFFRAWLPLILLVIANPFSVSFGHGLVGYASGHPTIGSGGYRARFETYNPDPVTRCYARRVGCTGLPALEIFIAYDIGVRSAISAFGVPSCYYDGPYPSKSVSLANVSTWPDLDVSALSAGQIRIDEQSIQLPPDLIEAFRAMFEMPSVANSKGPDGNPEIRARAALYEDRCVILRLENNSVDSKKALDVMILIDRTNQRPFAYYLVKGVPRSSRPLVNYYPPVRYTP